MISCKATVTEVYDDTVLLRPDSPESCQSCSKLGGCGMQLLGRAIQPGEAATNDERMLMLRRPAAPVHAGQRVTLSAPSRQLLGSVLLGYLLPLALVVLLALLMSIVGAGSEQPDRWVAGGIVAGLALAYGVLRCWSRLQGSDVSWQVSPDAGAL